MSSQGLLLRIVTPRGVQYENYVVSVKFKRHDGLMIIYKNYAPVLEQIVDGDIVITEGSKDKRVIMTLKNSWLTVSNNKCHIYSTEARSR